MIRNAKIEDAASIQRIYRHYVENTVISFEYEAPSVEEMEGRIHHYQENYPYLVLEENTRIVGYAYGSRYRERRAYDFTAEVSVYIDKDELGKGYGKRLAMELIEQLKEKEIYTVVAILTSGNERSLGLFLSLGFKLAGMLENVGYKYGKWHSITELILPIKNYD
ncbi:MAG: N-acetyltransferase family protein [Clostridiaceae bacterium]